MYVGHVCMYSMDVCMCVRNECTLSYERMLGYVCTCGMLCMYVVLCINVGLCMYACSYVCNVNTNVCMLCYVCMYVRNLCDVTI